MTALRQAGGAATGDAAEQARPSGQFGAKLRPPSDLRDAIPRTKHWCDALRGDAVRLVLLRAPSATARPSPWARCAKRSWPRALPPAG